jgi:hypothetical protein
MMTRLKLVLGSDEQDDLTAEVLRRFWARSSVASRPSRPSSSTAPLAARATVVDLAHWVRARCDSGR